MDMPAVCLVFSKLHNLTRATVRFSCPYSMQLMTSYRQESHSLAVLVLLHIPSFPSLPLRLGIATDLIAVVQTD